MANDNMKFLRVSQELSMLMKNTTAAGLDSREDVEQRPEANQMVEIAHIVQLAYGKRYGVEEEYLERANPTDVRRCFFCQSNTLHRLLGWRRIFEDRGEKSSYCVVVLEYSECRYQAKGTEKHKKTIRL